MALIVTFPPFPEESSLGYYRRLTQSNRLQGWKDLAFMAEVSQSRSGLFGQPSYIARTLGLEQQWVEQAEDVEKSSRALGRFHRGQHDAVCPHCLSDEAYIRGCWEHRYVTTCQVHKVMLVDRCERCKSPLPVSRPQLAYCECGHDLRNHGTTKAPALYSWITESLVAHSIHSKSIGPALFNVDTMAMTELITTLCQTPGHGSGERRRNAALPRTIEEMREFLSPLNALLLNWPKGFEDHVRQRMATGKPGARTLNSLLGPWYGHLKKICVHGPLAPFLSAVTSYAAKEFPGIVGLDAAGMVGVKSAPYRLVKDAASLLGVRRERLVQAVVTGEIAGRSKAFGARGLMYEVLSTEIERIARERADWISEARACSTLKVPPSVIKSLMMSKVLVNDLAWRGDVFKGGPISRISLEQLASAVNANCGDGAFEGDVIMLAELTSRRVGDKRALVSVFDAIAKGEVRAVGVAKYLGQAKFKLADVRAFFGTPLVESGLSVTDLTRQTRWKHESVIHWIELGLLQAETVQLRGQPCRVVLPNQLLRFCQTFMPLADLAKTIGTKSSALTKSLDGLEVIGGKQLPNGNQRGGLVRIADLVRMAIGGKPSLTTAELAH